MTEHTDLDASRFAGAPVYSQEMLTEVVAKKGFHAFQEMSLPVALASSGVTAPCIKHFTGFLTLRQGPSEAPLYLPELDRWQRAIISIHDYRFEYLAQTAENAALVQKTADSLQAILMAWIDTVPRLKHRITVSHIPNAGLLSIESHKVTGGTDIDALTRFLQTYLAANRLTEDIGLALEQAAQRQAPAAKTSSASAGPRQGERRAGWRELALSFSR